MDKARVIGIALAAASFLALGIFAVVVGLSYYRYRARHRATYKAIFHGTGWVEGDRIMEIAYEKCWRPRFKDISFFRPESIICGGHYVRDRRGLYVSLVAFAQDIDFDAVRIVAPDWGGIDRPLDSVTLERPKSRFDLNIRAVLRQEAIPTRLDPVAPLQVAFVRDGEVTGGYADLHFLGDFRDASRAERAGQVTKSVAARGAPLEPVPRRPDQDLHGADSPNDPDDVIRTATTPDRPADDDSGPDEPSDEKDPPAAP